MRNGNALGELNACLLRFSVVKSFKKFTFYELQGLNGPQSWNNHSGSPSPCALFVKEWLIRGHKPAALAGLWVFAFAMWREIVLIFSERERDRHREREEKKKRSEMVGGGGWIYPRWKARWKRHECREMSLWKRPRVVTDTNWAPWWFQEAWKCEM